MNEIYVFLGPTLAEGDARAELDAVYLPPVSEGDIYRLWRRRPRAVGIVDGHFECIPAVWHKEIMWIMERGVHVFGAASMGALRAAELGTFGMRGVGWVYQSFRDGALDRDDEVAVRHGAAEDGYRVLSEAMVNIRRTLQAARQQKIISDATRDILTRTGAALFYQDRNWPDLLRAAGAEGADAAELTALHRWLPAGRVDQQACDAVAMLREMRGFLAASPAPQRVSWSMASTTRWEALKRRAGTVPMAEEILDEVRLLGPDAFEAAQGRSLLRLFAGDFAERQGVTVDGERLADAVAAFRLSSGLDQGTEFGQFLTANELTADDVERLIAADELARWACEQAAWDALGDILNELRMRGEYARLAARARGKLDLHQPRSGRAPAPAGGARGEQAAIRWYFAERCGTTVPEDLAGHAQASGFPDEQAFRRAVRREYQYVREVTAAGAREHGG
jgi:hypothetical protein